MDSSNTIWQYSVVLSDKIGTNCNICSHVFVEAGVEIGNNVTIKNGCMLYDGVILEDNVFVGPNVTFTNDLFPVSKNKEAVFETTKVEFGAAIGGGSTICPGVNIGRNSLVGAGSVVTKDIPANEIWVGNPAKFLRNK